MYIELFLLDNLVMNWLTLRLACAFCARPCRAWRLAGFAALGTLYAFCALEWVWPGDGPRRVLFGAVMALAIPNGRRAGAYLRALGSVWLAAFLLGGVLLAARCMTPEGGEVERMLLLGAAAALLLPGVLRRFGRRPPVQRLCFCWGGRVYRMDARLDTGNALSEPISGLPVIVAAHSELAREAVIPIPTATAAGHTMLYALRPQGMTLDGVPVQALVAFASEPLEAALVPPMALL